MKCYQLLACEYYYIGDYEKARIYNERMMRGLVETDSSQVKKSAIGEIKAYKPRFNVFQS